MNILLLFITYWKMCALLQSSAYLHFALKCALHFHQHWSKCKCSLKLQSSHFGPQSKSTHHQHLYHVQIHLQCFKIDQSIIRDIYNLTKSNNQNIHYSLVVLGLNLLCFLMRFFLLIKNNDSLQQIHIAPNQF